jgi:serine/threonine protein kinase
MNLLADESLDTSLDASLGGTLDRPTVTRRPTHYVDEEEPVFVPARVSVRSQVKTPAKRSTRTRIKSPVETPGKSKVVGERAPLDSPSSEQIDPSVPKGYTFVKSLGRGTYGVVGEYIDPEGTHVAIKSFGKTAGSVNGIPYDALREAQTGSIMSGAYNTVQYISAYNKTSGSGDNAVTYFSIAMPLYDGNLANLATLYNMKQRIELLGDVTFQTVEGLYELHSRSLIHRDIKNDNILYKATRGEEGQVKDVFYFLGDFGFSRHLPCDATIRAIPMTRLAYSEHFRPPEVVRGQVYSEKADVWALGVTLLTWIAGGYVKLSDASVLGRLTGEETTRLSGRIGVKRWLEFLGHSEFYGAIDPTLVEAIESMLYLNPHERRSIQEVCGTLGNKCILAPVRTRILPRLNWSENHPTITPEVYYPNVAFFFNLLKALETNTDFKFTEPEFPITTLDILDRYFSNKEEAVSSTDFRTILFACILITSKLIGPQISVSDLSFYSAQDNPMMQIQERSLIDKEIEVCVTLHYILQSCETDVMLKTFPTFDSVYELYKMLSLLSSPRLPCFFTYQGLAEGFKCFGIFSELILVPLRST